MTKRRLESELEELSEELLSDLTPSERLQLALTASAAGRDGWVGQLSEMCAHARYVQPEWAFTARTKSAFVLGQQVMYDLKTTTLLLVWVETREEANQLLTFFSDLNPTDHGFTPPPRETRPMLFGKLYVHYEAYTQFADAELGVELDEWLALHPDGPATVALAEVMIEMNAGLRDFAEAEYADGNDEEVSLDDLAAQMANQLQDVWNKIEEKTE